MISWFKLHVMNDCQRLCRFAALLLLMLMFSCSETEDYTIQAVDTSTVKIFEKLPPAETGIDFRNDIRESDEFNYLLYDGIYQGAGVGVADFNNDGLQDIYFAGNMVPDRLYINKGNFQFEDITKEARINKGQNWSTGVEIADVNGDGYQDIYVSKFLLVDNASRKNRLYINNGDLTFKESAEEYGIADIGYSIMSNFFDYDLDGDLDLYVCNQPPNHTQLRQQNKGKINYGYTDRLYRNEGNGKFTDVTIAAGVENYSFSLSATVGDLNNDGWPDIYLANDYEEPDALYQNNGDGTFTNVAFDRIKHMSNFSMGSDIADFNNDGWLDIFTADMVAADNSRLKTNMSGMNPEKFWSLANNGYHFQYMFNALQLNNGNNTFSEVAQLSGTSNTDWSWAPLFVDFDNDGWKDLIVTNGMLRDVRDNDFTIRRKQVMQDKLAEAEAKGIDNLFVSPIEILNMAPSVKLKNYLYRNQGDLTFKEMMDTWGMSEKGWTHGAAYADFDNDGDVDIVMNAANDHAFVYRNTTRDQKLGNYVRFKLRGGAYNPQALGTRVSVHIDGKKQVQELSGARGYMSCSEKILHFGVKGAKSIDLVEIQWPSGQVETMENVKVNQVIERKLPDNPYQKSGTRSKSQAIFASEFTEEPLFQHVENDYDDFEREILIPHKMSHLGPCLATADVNGDGLEDFYVGGASGQSGALFVQSEDGNFEKADNSDFDRDNRFEDVSALFFDIDSDGDKDLVVGSGGNEHNEGSAYLEDRVYINNNGVLARADVLPRLYISTGALAHGDVDGDEDHDLFVGGRQVPGKYGNVPQSYVLKNNNGRFSDATQELAPEVSNIGMVTDAKATDIDGDGDDDLLLCGEWMPLTVLVNEDGKWQNRTEAFGLDQTAGWWNSLKPADLDGDGDMDFLAGNLGLNIKYKASEEQPFKVYVKDFDNNGTHDVYLGYYDADGICYPVRGRECSSQQMPFVKKEFASYQAFGSASIEDVLGPRIDGATYHEAKLFESVWAENKNGTFVVHGLPVEAQLSTVQGIATSDINGDRRMDAILVGNYYEREVETTRSDASVGCVLLGQETGGFKAMHPSETGFLANKNARDVVIVRSDAGAKSFIVANNDGPLQVFRRAE